MQDGLSKAKNRRQLACGAPVCASDADSYPPPNPDPLKQLLEHLAKWAGVECEIGYPANLGDEWWLDLLLDGIPINVSWGPYRGFGVYTTNARLRGSPDEFYQDPRQAAVRLMQLSDHWRRDQTTPRLSLHELRGLLGRAPSQIAEMLGADEARIHRLEGRRDIKLSALEGYVTALGGTLEVRVRFPSFEASLNLPEAIAPSNGGRRRHEA